MHSVLKTILLFHYGVIACLFVVTIAFGWNGKDESSPMYIYFDTSSKLLGYNILPEYILLYKFPIWFVNVFLPWLYEFMVNRIIQLIDFIKTIKQYVERLVTFVLEKIKELVGRIVEWIGNKLMDVIRFVGRYLDKIITWVIDRLRIIINFFGEYLDRLIRFIYIKMAVLFRFVIDVLKTLINLIPKICRLAWHYAGVCWDWIKWFYFAHIHVIFIFVWNLVYGICSKVVDTIYHIVFKIYDAVCYVLSKTYDIVCDVLAKTYDTVCSICANVYTIGCNVCYNAWVTACDVSSKTMDTVSRSISIAWTTICGMFGFNGHVKTN